MSVFDNSMTICVLLNTGAMAADYYGISDEEAAVLKKMNDAFTWIFIVEMSLKLMAVGVKKYWTNRLNWIDGSVVMISVVELTMAAMTGSEGGTGNL